VSNPSSREWPYSVLVATRLLSVGLACAALYWGKAVLVPLVLAALLTFMLSPLVTRLDRLRLHRIASVLLVMTFVAGVVGGVGYVVGNQLQSFAAELPTHRQNIRAKIREAMAFTRGGAIEQVQDTIEEISQVVEEEGAESAPPARERRGDEPVRVVQEPPSLLGGTQWLGSLFEVIGTAGLTLLLSIFMLINREDLRDRLVSLSGRPSLVLATKALTDAGEKISRYLVMQFVINASMGLAVGIGLYFIGVPYAALWGLAAGVLRYVPYVGPWVAAFLPIMVSLVTTPGWEQVLIVIAMFIVLELLSNNVMEPLLYGHSVGLSTLAVIVAAIFWTWLWGAVGLVIATPITACLVVLSSHVPSLAAIGQLLGQRPALRPHETLYQRLLANDVDEADTIVSRFRSEHSVDAALQLVLDTLLALKRDLQAGRVSADEGEHVITGLSHLLTDIHDEEEQVAHKPVRVIGAPGRDPLDALVLEIARVLLREEPLSFEILSTDLMVGEVLATVEKECPAAVVVPSLPPAGLTPARQLCLRLHARVPSMPIVAARLGDPESEVRDRVALLEEAGCSDVASSLDALKRTVHRVVAAAIRANPAPPPVAPAFASAVQGG
jgi:predicted PurR-regulated permease PerM